MKRRERGSYWSRFGANTSSAPGQLKEWPGSWRCIAGWCGRHWLMLGLVISVEVGVPTPGCCQSQFSAALTIYCQPSNHKELLRGSPIQLGTAGATQTLEPSARR
jgi:hypothetical protein